MPGRHRAWPLVYVFYNAATYLIELYRFEQRLEVAFPEAVVAFALDDFKENRSYLVLGEYLQQQAAIARAVEQYADFLQPGQIFPIPRQDRQIALQGKSVSVRSEL